MALARYVVSMLTLSAMAAGSNVAFGQAYPNKVIRIITAAAGGGSDFIARELSQGISGALGQQIIVENRGTGVLAGEAAAKMPPDGYTLTVQGGAFWISPLLRKAPYDPIADFSPISLIVREVNVLAVHPGLPVKSVKELVALAKSRPGELNYSSPGVGSTTHLASELFRSMAGIKWVHVPYQGNSPAITALISGEVQAVIIDSGLLMPHVKSGRLRALGATSLEPSALVPGMPTVASQGLPGFESIGMTGFFATGKPPAAIIERLNQEVVRFLGRTDIKERFLKTGVEIVGSTPQQFADAVNADRARVSKVVKEIGLKVD
jgi:tripartite-type tricarboxylate transporter receptor subunit TctC